MHCPVGGVTSFLVSSRSTHVLRLLVQHSMYLATPKKRADVGQSEQVSFQMCSVEAYRSTYEGRGSLCFEGNTPGKGVAAGRYSEYLSRSSRLTQFAYAHNSTSAVEQRTIPSQWIWTGDRGCAILGDWKRPRVSCFSILSQR
jgi:hypothetical protein